MHKIFFTSLLLFSLFTFDLLAENKDYESARWDPIHFQPEIGSASNEDCLSCHKEIIERKVLEKSPAGLAAAEALAWYQTLDTYEGPQETFHRRHLVTPLAKKLMNMQCNTCHEGNEPREEVGATPPYEGNLTLRKMVDPNICLMCHAQMNYKVMALPGPWHESRTVMGDSCVACHAAIRTNRHNVNFLNAEEIEKAGAESSDVCYGCHGGRSWYRIGFPYPRHAWEGMAEEVPDWAKDRPTESQERFRVQR